ncbi:MAG: AAA family ATPase [Bacteroidaceae bacterium]|nr:AAA family ATPase [Bacteroidaceae bacterium]
MEGFKNLEIKNFRGINHLKIDDCSRINVFLGQNNSGKTSILECLLLIMGMSSPDIPQSLNRIRSRNNMIGVADVRYMFNNLVLAHSPEIVAKQTDDVVRHLKLNLSYVFDEKEQTVQQNAPLPISESMALINTLEMLFDVTEGEKTESFRSFLTFNQAGIITNRKLAEGYVEKDFVGLITADLLSGNLVNDLSELFKRKKKDVILKRLAMFDKSIYTIDILNNDVYIGFEGINELLPLGMTGDGLRRYLNIVACSANPMTNIIVIDEIDNGLHYSAYKKLWEAIFALATNTNKQVFITTHSKETLYCLNEMLGDHPEYQQEMRLYTIAKTLNNGHQAYKYTYEGLSGACENDVELRGTA